MPSAKSHPKDWLSNMRILFKYCFFISMLIALVSSESLRVLRTTHDMASFSPSSGAELLNSSLHDLNEMTVCARFSTYQFITHGYREPLQVLLSVGEDLEFLSSYTMLPEPSVALGFWESLIGTKWQHGNVVGFSNADGGNIFPIWNMGSHVWNHICFISSAIERLYKIIMNGIIVYENKDFDGGHKKVNRNLLFMGKIGKDGYKHLGQSIFRR